MGEGGSHAADEPTGLVDVMAVHGDDHPPEHFQALASHRIDGLLLWSEVMSTVIFHSDSQILQREVDARDERSVPVGHHILRMHIVDACLVQDDTHDRLRRGFRSRIEQRQRLAGSTNTSMSSGFSESVDDPPFIEEPAIYGGIPE